MKINPYPVFRFFRHKISLARGHAALPAAVFLPLILAGCRITTAPPKTAATIPEAFSSTGTLSTPEKWWKTFDDQDLDNLISQAFHGNLTLKTAWAKLDQARAVLRRQQAPLWPALDASANLSRTAQESQSITDRGSERTYLTQYSMGLSASYEIDLWGRVRAARDAAALEAAATEQDLHAAALSLSAQVASVWYTLVEQRAQYELLQQQIATNRNYLNLVELRFRKGEVSATDVLQQEKLLESTRTEKAQVQAAMETLQHQLAVLTGQVPAKADFPAQDRLPTVPPLPQTGIPAKWTRARPDIQAAYLRIRAGSRSLATAIAEKFPRLSITGTANTNAPDPGALLEEWLAQLAANLAYPLFDAGRRDAEVDRVRAVTASLVHNYSQTLLTGIREVEDALSVERHQLATIQGVQTQLTLSNRTVTQLVRKYRNGTVNFLRVLDELKTQQGLQRQLLAARAKLLQTRIDLYLALGGTWDLQRNPTDVNTPQQQRKQETNHNDSHARGIDI